jgi:hypothetical protein
MARRVQINGRWVDAPDAPLLSGAGTTGAGTTGAGTSDLQNASNILSGITGNFAPAGRIAGTAMADWQAKAKAPAGAAIIQATRSMPSTTGAAPAAGFAPTPGAAPAVGSWNQALATSMPAGLAAATTGIEPAAVDLETRRRRAFLDSKDSMAGMRAVRGVLSDEVTRRGGTPAAANVASVRGLEGQLAKLGPAKGLGYDGQGNWTASDDAAGEAATLQAMAFTPGTVSNDAAGDAAVLQSMAFAPSGNLPQATANNYLQSDQFKNRVRSLDQPLNEVAPWQMTAQTITAPRQDPGREGMLAAYAARREAPPTTEGEAVLAIGAANPMGTRAGQFKPGNTVNLGHIDPTKLKPRNSTGYYSDPYGNPGNLF